MQHSSWCDNYNDYQYCSITTNTHFTSNFITWHLVSTLNSGHHQVMLQHCDCIQIRECDCIQIRESDCIQIRESDCIQIRDCDCIQIRDCDCIQIRESDCIQIRDCDCIQIRNTVSWRSLSFILKRHLKYV
jgi:hypothetical protein